MDGRRAAPQAYDTIVANSRFFDNDLSKVPTKALTVGVRRAAAAWPSPAQRKKKRVPSQVATVMDAREVLIIFYEE